MNRKALILLAALALPWASLEASSVTVREVSFSGNAAFGRDALLAVIGLQPGATFQAGAERVAAVLVKSHYERNGYLEARSTATAIPSDGGWTLRFRVEEGPLYRFGVTRYEGLDDLPERVPDIEMKYEKGDPYVRARLFETQSALYGTGYYDDVTISASTTTDHVADVSIRFRERPYKWLKGGVGWGSEERERATLILLHDNLFHRAYKAQLSGTWSAIWREYGLEFVNPYFWETRTEFRAQSLWRKEYREGYDFERTRGEAGFGRPLTRYLNATVSARVDRNIVYNLDPNIAATTPERSDARALSVALNRDTSNDFFFPTEGSRVRASVERYGGALGGLLDLHRMTLQGFHYRPVWRRLTAAFALRSGVVTPYGSTPEVPVFERYFTGGGNSVRGYDERDVGPKSADGAPLGGRRQLSSTIEARFPLFWRLRGAVFVDGGQVGQDWDDVSPRRWKYSAGGGLRFVTPVGPFRLDFGYKLNRDPDDLDPWRLHFSLGESF